MASIPGLTFRHGLTNIGGNDYFYFRARRNNVPEGYHVLLDPTFGVNDTGVGWTCYYKKYTNVIRGLNATCNDDGIADNITVRLWQSGSNNPKVKCAMYWVSNSTLISETEERTVEDGWNGWYSFNFSNPKPVLMDGAEYFLCCWANGNLFGWSKTDFFRDHLEKTLNYDSEGGSYPSPTISYSDSMKKCALYCAFTSSSIDTSVDIISPYVCVSSPLTITASGYSGLDNVTLWYRYSNDNASWGSYCSFGVDDVSPWSWSFNFQNGIGYYEFYSIGKKSGLSDESPPSSADARCNYRNQSKIKNAGSTDIKGYLLMQVQYYNTSFEDWVVADDTVNETNPRTINVSEQLALDLIFNGLVDDDDFIFGSGTYRVYAALRDPDGNVLIDDNGVSMNASYEFGYTSLQEITTMLDGWNWLSLPFNESVDKADLLVKHDGIYYTWADAVTEGIVVNIVYGWNRDTQQYEAATVFEPGYAYGIYAYEGCALYVEDVDENYDDFITNLKYKWNTMGIPYGESINKLDLIVNYNDTDYTWTDAVTEGIVTNTVNGWNRETQQYEVATVLEPGYGYWIWAYYDCILKTEK